MDPRICMINIDNDSYYGCTCYYGDYVLLQRLHSLVMMALAQGQNYVREHFVVLGNEHAYTAIDMWKTRCIHHISQLVIMVL